MYYLRNINWGACLYAVSVLNTLGAVASVFDFSSALQLPKYIDTRLFYFAIIKYIFAQFYE